MKLPIPLNSTLCTDSHENAIKDPSRDRDLFAKNQSYLFNKALTNPKKKTVEAEDYITTNGDILNVTPGSEVTQISLNGNTIAQVLSLGVEDISYLDKDDAVVDSGSLWTVVKTLTGYIPEQTDLQTQEITTTPIIQDGVLDVRFVKNTHKVITRNMDGSVTIDGTIFTNSDMAEYLSTFSGEFTAAEVNGKIYLGFNNPAGVEAPTPQATLDFNINANVNGWSLKANMDTQGADQTVGYQININVAAGVQIGGPYLSGSTGNGFSLDLLTGITNPQIHSITLTIGAGAIISGSGGIGGSVAVDTDTGKFTLYNGVNGTTAINCGSNLTITGSGTIQGGGGGGTTAGYLLANSMAGENTYFACGGGGGAGIPVGIAGQAVGANYTANGTNGTITSGGVGGSIGSPASINGGTGGGIAEDGKTGKSQSSKYVTIPGKAGAAIRLVSPAVCTVSGVTLIGVIVEV